MVQALEQELILVSEYEEADYIMFHPNKLHNHNPNFFGITLEKLYQLVYEYDTWTNSKEPFVIDNEGSYNLAALVFPSTLYKKNSQ